MTLPPDTEIARSLEERLVNVWPALSTLMMDGWVVRLANGYSGRANSASALTPGATMDSALLSRIEHLYRDAGLKPQFRITPVAASDTEKLLRAHGFRVKDEAYCMTMALTGPYAMDPRVLVSAVPERSWLEGISTRQEPSKRSPEHLLAIVSAVKLPVAHAILRERDTDIAFAYSAIDRGYAEIGNVMVDIAARGQGHGRAIVTSLLHWAASHGATHAFLQVDTDNTAALNLYGSFGFRRAYTYRTLVKD